MTYFRDLYLIFVIILEGTKKSITILNLTLIYCHTRVIMHNRKFKFRDRYMLCIAKKMLSIKHEIISISCFITRKDLDISTIYLYQPA